MNEITNYTNGISLYFGDGMQLMLIVFAALACVIILTMLVLLLLRRVRLWYWKVDLQVSALKAIDKKLTIIDENTRRKQFSEAQYDSSEQDDMAEQLAFEDVLMDNNFDEEDHDVLHAETSFCKSKTGIIYTEKELEELIKN